MRRQVFQRSRMGEPYDSMVVRVHECVLALLGAAGRGDVFAVLAVLDRLAGQAGALKELLELRKESLERGR